MPRSAPTFRFRSTLYVDLAPARAYDLLEDIAAYPSWWPQVRSVAKLDEDTALVAAQSLLPYTLHFAQQVTTPGRVLQYAARVARPVLVLNHRWMMRGARRGLAG